MKTRAAEPLVAASMKLQCPEFQSQNNSLNFLQFLHISFSV